jgi:hypothetical protein
MARQSSRFGMSIHYYLQHQLPPSLSLSNTVCIGTHLGQQVTLVSVLPPSVTRLEHAFAYPTGQIPGEKYALRSLRHPDGKQLLEVVEGPSWT